MSQAGECAKEVVWRLDEVGVLLSELPKLPFSHMNARMHKLTGQLANLGVEISLYAKGKS